MRNCKNNVKKPTSANKNSQSLARNPPDQVKTSVLELDMATVQERRYKESKEYEEFDMFHTDRNIVRDTSTSSSRRTRRVRMCRAHCSEMDAIGKSSSPSHTSGDCIQGAIEGWMTGSSASSCCAAQTDPWRPPCTMPSAVRSTPSPRPT